ncbi:hypothetical protein D9M69_632180 [compost metagenome]
MIVSERVAPRPSEPSRSERGTDVMISSDSDDTNGISITPMTRPAVSTLCAMMKP